MKNVALVTGAQGFIGRYAVGALLAKGSPLVVGVGRSKKLETDFTHAITRAGRLVPARLPVALQAAISEARYVYRQADVKDVSSMQRIIDEFSPSVVVHLAGTPREASLTRLLEGNVVGTCALALACASARQPVEVMILGSSGGVYSLRTALPIREDSPCEPLDAYAASKLTAEMVAQQVCEHLGVKHIVARIFNVLGPGQDERHLAGRFGARIAELKRCGEPAVLAVENLESTRDYVDSRDVGSALALLAARGQAGETYNIGAGIETSVKILLSEMISCTGMTKLVSLTNADNSRGGVERHVADRSRLDALGLWQQYGLRESIKDIVAYYDQWEQLT